MASHVKRDYIQWVYTAKGIGIFLVILGHAIPDGNYYKILIYAFHMPFFFFLSGLLFHVKKGLKELSIGKAKSLLIPYLIYLVSFSLYGLLIGQKPTWSQIFFFRGITIWNDPIWFLPVLFMVQVLAGIILLGVTKCGRPHWYLVTVCMSLLIFGSWCYSNDITDYFGFQKVILGLAFFVTGNYCRNILKNNRKTIKNCAILTTGGGCCC